MDKYEKKVHHRTREKFRQVELCASYYISTGATILRNYSSQQIGARRIAMGMGSLGTSHNSPHPDPHSLKFSA